MQKITFYSVKGWQKIYLKKQLKNYDLKFYDEIINKDNLEKNTEILGVFVDSNVDKKIINSMSKLKKIVTLSTGFDHIDLKECNKKNIEIFNVPTYGENTVAEHTFALILALSRKVHKAQGVNNFNNEKLMGFDLKGKTIGVVGGGNIGMHVVRIAKGFGMNVLVFDVNKQRILSENMCFKYMSLDDLLKKSDIVTLHVPLNKFTEHLINKDNIKLLNKNAIIINTSRGGIIDTDALLKALEKKQIKGAGLDVIEGENLILEEDKLLLKDKNSEHWKSIIRAKEILNMDNVVFTPHIAFNSKEAITRILDATIDNIKNQPKENKVENV